MRLVIIFLFSVLAFGQDCVVVKHRGTSSCATPIGPHLTESFGDSSTGCWASGPSTCNYTWTVGAGTGHAIVSSPAEADANTACAGSIQMTVTGNSQYVYKTTASIPSTTTVDVYLTVYIVSHSIGYGDADPLVQFSADTGYGNSTGQLYLGNAAGVLSLAMQGSTLSSWQNISPGTWYTVHIHLDATAANSYFTVKPAGGAEGQQRGFTRNAKNLAYVIIGNVNGGLRTETYHIGNLYF